MGLTERDQQNPNGTDRVTPKAKTKMVSFVWMSKLSLSKWGSWVGKFGTDCAFSRNFRALQLILVSPLDFGCNSDDTSSNLLAAPLLYPVTCPYSDVHHWRVFLLPKLKLYTLFYRLGDSQ